MIVILSNVVLDVYQKSVIKIFYTVYNMYYYYYYCSRWHCL